MNVSRDVKTDLTVYLRELHLPAIRQCFEEKARQAERETLSYEQYLLDLAERECQERRENRIARLLRESIQTRINKGTKRLTKRIQIGLDQLRVGLHLAEDTRKRGE